LEVELLRRRVAELEREIQEDEAKLRGEMGEDQRGAASEASTVMEEDSYEVESNHSHAPTEVFSEGEQVVWADLFALPLQQ
jgi:hypothetical protein